jgi:hypothetical protein
MAENPYVERIFELAGFINGKERMSVAVAMIATEAYHIAKQDAKFADYMNQRCGLGWYENPGENGSVETVVAFFQYLQTGAFAKPKPVTISA